MGGGVWLLVAGPRTLGLVALSTLAGVILLACGSGDTGAPQATATATHHTASPTTAAPATDPAGTMTVAEGATSNVSIDTSADGNTVAVGWYAYDDATGVERTYVATSTDGGITFGEPVVVTEPATEYPQVAVLYDGSILVGALTYDIAAHVVEGDQLSWPGWMQLFKSSDHGKSFTRVADLHEVIGDRVLTSGMPSTMAASDDGQTVVFTWRDHTPASHVRPGEPAPVEGTVAQPVWASVSTDGGKTFGSPQAVADSSCGCCAITAFLAGGRPGVAFRGLRSIDAEHDERDPMLFLADESGQFGTGTEIHDDAFVMGLDGCPASGPGVVEANGVISAAWWTQAEGREGWWFARSPIDAPFSTPVSLPAEFSITYSVEMALDGSDRAWVIGYDYESLNLKLWSVDTANNVTPHPDIAPLATRATEGYDIAGLRDGAIAAWTYDGVVKVLRVGA